MKNMIRSLVLVPAVVFASVAFAAETSTVNVPFTFTANGQSFAAGKYTVAVDPNSHVATLTSPTEVKKSVAGNLTPANGNPSAPASASLEFATTGSTHQLRKIKYGAYSTAAMSTADRKAKTEVATAASQSSKASNGR